VIVSKLNAAVRCLVAAAFALLFVYITGRRVIERDGTGAIFAGALALALIWATVRTFRRFQRS
jgi:hypothetical protein